MNRRPEIFHLVLTPRGHPQRPGHPWRSAAPTGTAVLVVEGDESFASGLEAYIGQEGFSVRTVADGAEGLAEFERHPPQMVLVALDLSGLNGLDLCRRIRAVSNVPIIVMSAKGSEVDAVLALEMGADDYVSRACRMRELVARMRAALRRAPVGDRDDPRGILKVGPVMLDRHRCEVTLDGKPLNLPRKEYRLLELLMEHPGRVFSRQTLIERVWGEDYVGTTKTLDVHVRRLRTKLEEDPATPRRIVTVRGLGFKLEPPRRTNVTPIHSDMPRPSDIDGLRPAAARPDGQLLAIVGRGSLAVAVDVGHDDRLVLDLDPPGLGGAPAAAVDDLAQLTSTSS